MKKGRIIRLMTGAYFGFILAIVGFNLLTWQFWAILVPVTFGFIVGGYLENNE